MCWWWIWNGDWGLGGVVVVGVKGRVVPAAAAVELGVAVVMVAGKLEGFSVFLVVEIGRAHV